MRRGGTRRSRGVGTREVALVAGGRVIPHGEAVVAVELAHSRRVAVTKTGGRDVRPPVTLSLSPFGQGESEPLGRTSRPTTRGRRGGAVTETVTPILRGPRLTFGDNCPVNQTRPVSPYNRQRWESLGDIIKGVTHVHLCLVSPTQ